MARKRNGSAPVAKAAGPGSDSDQVLEPRLARQCEHWYYFDGHGREQYPRRAAGDRASPPSSRLRPSASAPSQSGGVGGRCGARGKGFRRSRRKKSARAIDS
jgi:hypothetical protein